MSSLMYSKPICIKCGICCTQLSWDERLKISLHSKSFMFSKICKFLEIDDDFIGNCLIQDNKPKICRDFHCGVNILMDELIGADMFEWKEDISHGG